jgi:uncharacterized protein YraI
MPTHYPKHRISSSSHRFLILILIALLLFAFITGESLWQVSVSQAQAEPTPAATTETISADVCGVPFGTFLLTASDACVGQPFGFVCNGGLRPIVQPEGAVSNSLAEVGSLVEAAVIESLQTSSLSSSGEQGGIAWLRIATEDSPLRFSGLLIGDVRLTDRTPEGFPNWQNFVVETINPQSMCAAAPASTFVVQSLPGQPSRVVINGMSLAIDGTLAIQTETGVPDASSARTHFLAISGLTSLLTAGQTTQIFAGQEVSVTYVAGEFAIPVTAPGQPANFRPELVANLPILLFDFPVQVPQSGSAVTLGAVNLRTAPTTDAGVILQSNSAERLTILGKNPDGDPNGVWYHVEMANGQTGWMFGDLLVVSGEVSRNYIETPEPLQRMGDLGTVARVIAPNGVTLHNAPDLTFGSVGSVPFDQEVTLLNRSPYNPWVKIDAKGQIGWVALITLQTRAIIESLPVDYDVPPPPEPTRIPGSFGNAFPDPNCFPNCG